MHQRTTEMMDIFEGYPDAYGTYKMTGESKGKKQLGKATSYKGPVTVELWAKHLSGSQGLGIIPINANSEVKFAAIDVDVYDLNLLELNQKIQSLKLPLVLCRTKSGGAHLYMFLSKFTDAKIVVKKMREFAALLGYGDAEIFPKQSKIIVERGDVGQWINVPYFHAAASPRWGMSDQGNQMSLDAFVDYVRGKMVVDADKVEDMSHVPEEALPGGPPCLQALIKSGFPDGSRNNGLFNLAVYARKSHPDDWQRLVEKYNMERMDPPLTASEVLGVIKSVGKKEFNYMCDQQPIRSFCNAPLCRTCKFGIRAQDNGFPVLGTLTKLCTEPPIWFIDVEGGQRLELRTEDLQSPLNFQYACMEKLNLMPHLPKRDEWTEVVRRLLEDVVEVEMPKEMTPRGQFVTHVEDFCTIRAQGKSHDELLLGKPWTNNGRHYFRMRDLIAYLDRQKFRGVDVPAMGQYLRELGGQKHFFNVKGKGMNVYSIPEFKSQVEPLDVPEQRGDVPYA